MSKKIKSLVIVESPTKAKTIKKFLPKEFVVESCMGHVRDLPASTKDVPEKYKKLKWAQLGVNVEDGFKPLYCVSKDKQKVVKNLKSLLKDAGELILATDEDREGESISWHLLEILSPKVTVKRMVFHEITKEAIQESLEHFRDVDENLVKSQEARRILDRLVGYTLSPLLWKKIAYGLSAGRVQSAAVRLISEKEKERIRFKKTSYWSLKANLSKGGKSFEARFSEWKGKKLALGKDFDPETGKLLDEKKVLSLDEKKADGFILDFKKASFEVKEIKKTPISRNPYPPFITSSLQQEASRKFGFGSKKTMTVAQKLYEKGHITYMRTDSTTLSKEALKACQQTIIKKYGKELLAEKPRTYEKKKVKGAQEAHEAIRPAGRSFQDPQKMGLKGDELKIYDLIWKRTIASQMKNLKQEQTLLKMSVGEGTFSASGLVTLFPGFLKVYDETREDETGEDKGTLPSLKKGDLLDCKQINKVHHETKPPARYTEASLIQIMEKEGIGRPSTYASIITTIQNRGYVKKVSGRLIPTFVALIVTKLLSKYLPNYVDLGFTAKMEDSLDEIARGDLDFKKYLKSIYSGSQGLKKLVEDKEKLIDVKWSRSLEIEGLNSLIFRVGRYGSYVCRVKGGEEECATLPIDEFPGTITEKRAKELIEQKLEGPTPLGKDKKSKKNIYILSGRYGPYVQLGEKDDEKAKRVSLPKTLSSSEVSLDQALFLLSLPKVLGKHPDTGKEVKLGLGRYGPYIHYNENFWSVPAKDEFFEFSFEKALELISQPVKGRKGGGGEVRDLGKHPKTKKPVKIFKGRYGLYIKYDSKNIPLKGVDGETVNIEEALPLIENYKKKKA